MTPAEFRPGAQLAGRPLHFILLLDTSGSMRNDGKIEALNKAIEGALPHLRELAAQNPFVRLLVRTVCFADGARWHIGQPTPVDEVSWRPVEAGGYTDLGSALGVVADVLTVPPMESRAFPPVLVLISDGHPTDDYQRGLDRLFAEPWGRRAVRLAIAIGGDADREVLSAFIDDPQVAPFSAGDPEQLAYLVRFVSTAASQIASQPAMPGEERQRLLEVETPRPAAGGMLVW